MKVADVILAMPFDQEFSYKIPDEMNMGIGSIVQVFFGKRIQVGVVTNTRVIDDFDYSYELKDILKVYNFSLIPEKLIEFAKWVSRYNITYFGNIVKMILLSRKNIEYKIDHHVYEKFKTKDSEENCVKLSGLQEKIVEDIRKFSFDKYSSHLILGATGSGKTEIYLEITQQVINNGSQVLILLPEILLATQLIERFKRRLRNCRVAEWNSSLTPKNKSIIWHGVSSGNIDVIIGARSALFLPFIELKLIIIDEENDGSFKQEDGIVYNARDMAIFKAHLENFMILLSTATPSAETYYNTKLTKHNLHKLSTRYTGVLFPEVSIVDMTKDKFTDSRWISQLLKDEITSCLKRDKLSMIFLNRRGYAPLTICGDCGEKFSCPNCQFFLVEHRKKNKMLCHYCGYVEEKLVKCSKCDSDQKLTTIGAGIEKIEEEIRLMFPEANIISITSDTVSNFKHAAKIISDIENKKYQIIIGTQMLAKGLNFPDLHLVGVIDSDVSFGNCDLKVLERTFQMLYQVAGRAGREDERGKVILQSYFTHNPIFKFIKNWDYESFIESELLNRRDSNMPPFSKLAMVKAKSFHEESLHSFMHYIVKNAPRNNKIEILGPAPAPIYKINNYYRYRVIIRSPKEFDIQKYIEFWFQKFKIPKQIKIKVDIDPYNFA